MSWSSTVGARWCGEAPVVIRNNLVDIASLLRQHEQAGAHLHRGVLALALHSDAADTLGQLAPVRAAVDQADLHGAVPGLDRDGGGAPVDRPADPGPVDDHGAGAPLRRRRPGS